MIKFSVIMPFYKGDNPKYLDEALNSLFIQTLRADEIVLIQDGPVSNEHRSLVFDWQKKMPEINWVVLEKNQGLSNALNAGIDASKNEWLARMDADDVCLPNRFKKQISEIENNSNLAIIGSWIREFDQGLTEEIGIRKLPKTTSEIVKYAKWRCPFNHMTVMFRKSVIQKIGPYKNYNTENTNGFGEDYELWARFLVNDYECANIQEVLVNARAGKDFYGKRRRGWDYYRNELNEINDLKQHGLINSWEWSIHVVSKAFIRLSPVFIVKTVYKIMRN